LREILPNAMQPVIVQVALDASIAILIEAGLGFLGLSDPNMVSWGQLLFAAQDYMDQRLVDERVPRRRDLPDRVGLNLFADGLNEIADPAHARHDRSAMTEAHTGLHSCPIALDVRT
jgi:peptide/nickel transport system permease protein